MLYAQPRISPDEWDAKTPLQIWDKIGSPNLGQTTRPYYNQQKKRICRIMDFVILGDHRVKLKEREKNDKYLDVAREFKKKINGTWQCNWWLCQEHLLQVALLV